MTLSIEHLDFSYGRWPVLRDISVAATAGRITAIIGPNAAGKSTLLRCMIGALQPARGRVLLNGYEAHRLWPRELAQHIAYVPQRSIVSAAFTVKQVVELGRYALPANIARVHDAIERLDLSDVIDRPYPALSVGQQQRVTLARAVAQLSPDGCLILDEPTAAMDLQHVASCMQLLQGLARGGATVVFAIHDLSLAAATSDEVWLMNQGQLTASGPAQEVLQLERLRSVFGVDFEWVRARNGESRLIAASMGSLAR
jgi:iron complex transport system ATP-binding protein